jgi:hypothetical protein
MSIGVAAERRSDIDEQPAAANRRLLLAKSS